MVDAVVYLNSICYSGKITAISRRGRIPLDHKFYDQTVPRPVYDFTNNHSLKDVLTNVRAKLKIYKWRLVVDGLRPYIQLLWSHWSTKERSQFLRYLRPLWDIHRHRISPLHKNILDDLRASGRLEIKTIGMKKYLPQTKIVLKCNGLSQSKNTFILNLIEKNLVTCDCFQLGIESKKSWIHIIGPLNRGRL